PMDQLVLVLVFFFFASRRRHTRLVSDWSSDVCSSDLAGSRRGRGQLLVEPLSDRLEITADQRLASAAPGTSAAWHHHHCDGFRRSEERRVGKECRSRGAADDLKKKERSGRERCERSET